MADVYAIGFPSGKLYIGITSRTAARRLSEHITDLQRGLKLIVHNALRKYGRNVKLMVLAQGVSFEEAKDLEIWWISRLGTMTPNGYNLTAGGDGALGLRHTVGTKARMREAKLGKNLTEEHKERIGIAGKGRKRSISAIEKTAKANRGRKRSDKAVDNMRKAQQLRKEKERSIYPERLERELLM